MAELGLDARRRRPRAAAEPLAFWPRTSGRRWTAAGSVRRLGPRPPLLARPDGALEPTARRAHDPRLARLVRDRRHRPARPEPAPERAFQKAGAGLVQAAADQGHPRPRDADLALGHREHEMGAERELRARADGALHPRRRRRLQRGRRPRAGPRADRLDQRLGRRHGPDRLPLRAGVPRRPPQADLRPEGQVRLARLLHALPRAQAPPRLPRRQALVVLRADAARRSPPARACASSTSRATTRSGRSSRPSSSTRRSTRARGW